MRKVFRSRLRAGFLGLIGVVAVAVAVAMLRGDAGANNALASVVGTFVGLAALAASLVSLSPKPGPPPSAEDLAADLARTIRGEWLDEAGSRKLRDPKVLPLTWSSGRMNGPFEEATRQLTAEYRRIRTGRLVVLGEPGSGKTVLAMLLTLGLIADRQPEAPVPVLLSASSWDPVRHALDEWIVHTLAGAYYNGRTDTPRMLLTRGLVLPVLDGLDEIPEVARRHAVHRINSALGTERPVVVTCRSAEYDDLIEAGSPALRRAPVQRVAPLAVEDVIAHLEAVPDWPASDAWQPVYAELRRAPDGPLAAGLSTPLMVSLALSAYRRGGDPAELLDTARFPSRHAVEDHLVDGAIDAAYAPNGARERAWLTFLARYLHDHRERDLAWWRLADRLMSPWVAPMVGVAVGVGMLLLVLSVGAVTEFSYEGAPVSIMAIPVGAVVALLATALWFGSAGRAPGRTGVVWQGSARRLRRGFRIGAAFVLVPAVPTLSVGAIFGLLEEDVSFYLVNTFAVAIVVVVGLLGVVGCAVAVHHWLDAVPERSARATPLGFVRQDRRAALVGALVAGAVTAVLTWPVLAAAVFVGGVFGQGLAGWSGLSGTAGLSRLDHELQLATTAQAVGALVLVPFLGVTLLVLLTRAWPRFVIASTVLAATRRLPWRLLRFLADARSRGLLRHSGGTYQFRHVRLQQRLALPTGDRPSAQTVPRRRSRVGALALTVSLLAASVLTVTTFNHLRCMPAFSVGTQVDRLRQYGDTGQSCLGVVSDTDLNSLATEHDAVARLLAANGLAGDRPTIAVLLPLGRAPLSDQTLSAIDGIVLAQRESLRLGQPARALLVNNDNDNPYVALGRLDAFNSRTGSPVRAAVTSSANISGGVEIGSVPIFGMPTSESADDPLTLRESTMHNFIQSVLGPQNARTIYDKDNRYYREECVRTEDLVTMLRWPSGMKPTHLDDMACHRNPIVATADDELVAYLRSVNSAPFTGVTLYYPVPRPSPARDYAEVAQEAGLAPDSVTARNAYQAMLNAAGNTDFTVHRITATPNSWTSPTVAPQ